MTGTKIIHEHSTRPSAAGWGYYLSFVPGAIGSAMLLASAWAWNQRYELRTGYEKSSDVLISVPTPGLWVHLVALLGIGGLLWWVAHRWEGERRARMLCRCRTGLTGFALLSLPFSLLSGYLAPDGAWLGMLWHIGLPLVATAALVALAAIAVPLVEGQDRKAPSGRRLYRLWILFFILVHLPSLWFARPWEDRFYRHRHLGGDEPRYLLVTHSLAQDRDFNLYNNYVENHRDRYICWTNPYSNPGDEAYAKRAIERGAGPPHSTAAYWQARRYGIERLGMPLLLAPAYKVGLKCFERHRYAVVTMLNLVLVFTMANIYLLARRLTRHHGASLMAALAAGLSAPIIFYGVSAYTEPVSAALIIFCVRKSYEFREGRHEGHSPSLFTSICFGLGLAYLPWVHEKMIPFTFVLLVLYILSARPRWRTAIPVAVTLLISVALQARYYWVLYGQCTPPAVHGLPFRLATLFKEGLWGLILDQKRGVLPAAPWVLGGAIGLGLWVRRQWRFALWPTLMVVAFLVMTGSFGGWYGGGSAQPRYMLNVIPLIAVGLAVAWDGCRQRAVRVLILASVVLGMVQGVNAVLAPDFLSWHRAPFLRDLYPCVFRLDLVEWITIAAWMVGLFWLGIFLIRWPRQKGLVVIPCISLLVILGGAGSRFQKTARPTVAVYNPKLLKAFFTEDIRFPTFNQRIMMLRWERAYSARRLEPLVLGARTQYENKVSPHCRVAEDGSAMGGAVALWEGEAASWLPLTAGPVLSLYEGNYCATFRLKAQPATAATAPLTVHLVVRAGGQEFGHCLLAAMALSSDWADYPLPFTLPTPVRGVDMSVQVQGTGAVQMDYLQLDYLPQP